MAMGPNSTLWGNCERTEGKQAKWKRHGQRKKLPRWGPLSRINKELGAIETKEAISGVEKFHFMFYFIGIFGRVGRDGFLIELDFWVPALNIILFDNKMYICFTGCFFIYLWQHQKSGLIRFTRSYKSKRVARRYWCRTRVLIGPKHAPDIK